MSNEVTNAEGQQPEGRVDLTGAPIETTSNPVVVPAYQAQLLNSPDASSYTPPPLAPEPVAQPKPPLPQGNQQYGYASSSIRPEPENTSGMMGDVPPEIDQKKFHWGAALMSTFWAKDHGINGLAALHGAGVSAWFIGGFLAWIGVEGAWLVHPVCIIVVPGLTYYLGRIGYREAWRYKRFPGGVEEFFEEQRAWTRRGFIVAPLCLVGIAALLAFISWEKYTYLDNHPVVTSVGTSTVPTPTSGPAAPAPTASPSVRYIPTPSTPSSAPPQPTYQSQPSGAFPTQPQNPVQQQSSPDGSSTQLQQPSGTSNSQSSPMNSPDQQQQAPPSTGNYGGQPQAGTPDQGQTPAGSSNGAPPAGSDQSPSTGSDPNAQSNPGGAAPQPGANPGQ